MAPPAQAEGWIRRSSLVKPADDSIATGYTVATGVAGEPKEPGRRSGGAVRRKR
jgi:hypothetical protein